MLRGSYTLQRGVAFSSHCLAPNSRTLLSEPIEREYYDWGTVMYMISREGAKLLVGNYLLENGVWDLAVWLQLRVLLSPL